MKKRNLVGVGVVILVFFALTQFAEAQKVQSTDPRAGKFILEAGLGLQADTPDGTAFALGVSGDFFLTQGFSIGPLLQAGYTGDLFQFGLSAQAKYTFDIKEIPELKPHVQAGIGFIYSDLENGRKEDDTSWLIPIGLGAEYRLTNSVSLNNTFLFNFTNLDVRDTNYFFTWLIGLRYRF